MAKVIWTEPALEDLHAIIAFISKDSLFYAERLAAKILHSSGQIRTFPYIGRVVPEFDDKAIRELIYGAYRIVYKVEAETCYIIAVMHGSRDILKHITPGDWDVQ